ncbi:MAG: hypothetical protein AUG49_14065 [Catenulispora sp. 13_1_20CM_3_70_7]|nr:MAG: hypothetical protein AUG49_14065 [Catenulispora sp. 13_1_20CM_3_70_7]
MGQWLLARPPQALQVDQLGVVWQFQAPRGFRVAFSAQCHHVAALLQAPRLDLLEQAVQAAQRLLDRLLRKPGAPTASGVEHT